MQCPHTLDTQFIVTQIKEQCFDDDYDEFNIGVSFAMTDDLSISLDYSNGENTATDQSETDYDIGTVTIDYGRIFTYGTGVSVKTILVKQMQNIWKLATQEQ